jgi:hypothetical protein
MGAILSRVAAEVNEKVPWVVSYYILSIQVSMGKASVLRFTRIGGRMSLGQGLAALGGTAEAAVPTQVLPIVADP